MSQEGILKYPPLLLLPLEGPEIHLHDRSIAIEILKKNNILPEFSVTSCLSSAFSSEDAVPVI